VSIWGSYYKTVAEAKREAEEFAKQDAKFKQHLLDKYGLTTDDLLKAADEKFMSGSQWTKEELNKIAIISMTKTEAMQKLKDAGVPRDISGDYHIIKILEALGLIHLEPPEVRLIKAVDIYGNCIELTDATIKDIALMYDIKI